MNPVEVLARSQSAAIDTSQVKSLGIVAIVVIVLVGLLIARLVTKLAIRAIVLIVIVVLAVAVYQQRDRVSADVRSCNATFFGIHVQPHNLQVRQACQDAAHRISK